jgi:hypothetical protein
MYIDNILSDEFDDNKGYYAKCSYSGYTVQKSSKKDAPEDEKVVSFAVTVAIEGRESAYHPDDAA